MYPYLVTIWVKGDPDPVVYFAGTTEQHLNDLKDCMADGSGGLIIDYFDLSGDPTKPRWTSIHRTILPKGSISRLVACTPTKDHEYRGRKILGVFSLNNHNTSLLPKLGDYNDASNTPKAKEEIFRKEDWNIQKKP